MRRSAYRLTTGMGLILNRKEKEFGIKRKRLFLSFLSNSVPVDFSVINAINTIYIDTIGELINGKRGGWGL